ncbi:MAG: S9 family peptidase [Rhodomicrobium sp.]
MDYTAQTAPQNPPAAEIRPARDLHHGIERVDNYAWLRAANWQEVMRDPASLGADIRAYLEAENAYTKAAMADTEALQDRLFKEMKGRLKEDDSTVPAPDGAYAYFTSYVTSGQHPRICRQLRDGGETAVLLDGDALAAGRAFFSLGATVWSHDHRLLAYSFDDKGSEFFKIKLRDLATGQDLADEVADMEGEPVWNADGTAFYYTRVDEHRRPLQVMRHRVGTDAAQDEAVYREPDSGFFTRVHESQDRRFIVVSTGDHETGEVRLLDLTAPAKGLQLIAPRETNHEYLVEPHGDQLIILTNEGGAEDYKLVEAPLSRPGRENWRDLVPHKPGRLILDVTCFKDYLVRLEREDGLPRIVIRRFADGEEHAIAFAEEAYSLGMSEGYEYDTETLRFVYSSMTTPRQVFDYNMRTRERTLRKTQEVPSGHNPADYVTRRVFAPAWDGETVPVSLLYRKDTPLDGTAPLLLYGYGSYGYAIPAGFSTNAFSLVDRGFVYAIAHIRGGKDKGYRWYKDGKLEKKTNTFKDFIAAGHYLAEQRFTSAGRIVAQGGSAGGMLMGAVANMAPELFAGIVADVPFVDVLTTMLDDTLPLTPPEWPEWGAPIDSAQAYRTIAAYSPYDNVRAQSYPHILATGGLTDPRVTYWEPAKWVAKLRANKTDANLALLKINMEAGHAGASGRFDRLKEDALAYAFALKVAGKL